MSINTKSDWIELARKTVPLLPDYMYEMRGNVDTDKIEAELTEMVEAEDWKSLYLRFEQIWQWLPDNPRIRVYPFGPLCDLCSEYWVFQEDAE